MLQNHFPQDNCISLCRMGLTVLKAASMPASATSALASSSTACAPLMVPSVLHTKQLQLYETSGMQNFDSQQVDNQVPTAKAAAQFADAFCRSQSPCKSLASYSGEFRHVSSAFEALQAIMENQVDAQRGFFFCCCRRRPSAQKSRSDYSITCY